MGQITAQVAQAFNHFGLGGSPSDQVPNDPVAWLTNQLSGTDPLANGPPALNFCLGWAWNVMNAPPHSQQQQQALQQLQQAYKNEVAAFFSNALTTATPFRERLVWFFMNHFAVQTGSVPVTATAGNFVRTAIRPYITDTFVNMLLAVMQHPAMLVSLNNDQSIGPDSALAQRLDDGSGINENLARETLELFTVGLDSGFTQADVDALAYMLTGWNVCYTGQAAGFALYSDMHEPGPQTMMGQQYPGLLVDAYSALQYLGTHPATYQRLATKLVTHFTSDDPAQDDIDTVNNALSSTGGSIAAAMAAIIGLQNAWVPQSKLRRPSEFVVATARALGAGTGFAHQIAADIGKLGEPLWSPPFPAGWSDYGIDWASASGEALRTNWINGVAGKFHSVNVQNTAWVALGPLINPATTAMMGRVKLPHDKLTILFCSPDFQRR